MGEFYQESNNMSKSYADRYKNCKILKDNETEETLLSTRELINVPESPNDVYHRVKSNEVARLDIIAGKYYKNPLLWWVIAQANDIYDPLESLESGALIRIPSIESLYGNGGILL